METLALIAARMEAAGIAYTAETEGVEQEDWQNGWRKYYHPLEIGKRLAVVPSWQQYDTDRVKLILDPGLALRHRRPRDHQPVHGSAGRAGDRRRAGAGHRHRQRHPCHCGAEAGRCRGRGRGHRPCGGAHRRENAALNGVQDKLTVLVGDLSDKASGKYDIITANIVANAILSLAPAVPGLMAEVPPLLPAASSTAARTK